MKQRSFFRCNYTLKSCGGTILFIIFISFLQGCGPTKALFSNKRLSYPGTIFLTGGKKLSGLVEMPFFDSKSVTVASRKTGAKKSVASDEIAKIEFYVAPSGASVMRYMPTKGAFGKIRQRWVARLVAGPFVVAYIGAETFTINSDGRFGLKGTSQTIVTGGFGGHSTTTIPPSFPVYLMKKGESVLTQVALTEGVSFEGSAFRSGFSRFLADDPQLSAYIRGEKWDINNLAVIVKNYNPQRGAGQLLIDGVAVVPKKKELLTNDLNDEMITYVELTVPSDANLGSQFALGIRSSKGKFFAYGGDIGYGSAKYVDQSKRMSNHKNHWADAPVIDADMSREGQFRFNAFAGGQLPLDLGAVYLIPAAHISFGGLLGTEYSAFNYGPMATLDVGFKMKYGSVLFLGTGWRRAIPLVGEETRESAIGKFRFEAYKPYNNLLFRVAYKF